MLERLRERLQHWLGVKDNSRQIKALEQSLQYSKDQLARKLADLDHLTREDWDIGIRGNNTIILTGVYRGRGYVQFYDIPPEEFRFMVERYREMKRGNLIRNVDYPKMSGSFDIFS